jgi:hypothetical protein
MPGARNVQNCRWAEPTLFLAHPLWVAAEEYTWSCQRDGAPRTLADTETCTTCARWESRGEGRRRNPGDPEAA